MRTRNKAVTIRMKEEEYAHLMKQIAASGLSQQSYVLGALNDEVIVSSDALFVLRDVSGSYAELVKQIRGIATNLNQMAHVANATGHVQDVNRIGAYYEELCAYRKELEDQWQLIRRSTAGHHPMRQ